VVEHDGEHFHVHDTQFLPPPLQRPRVPVWVAGTWPYRAPFRRAARWDGVFPQGLDEDGRMVSLPAERYPELLAFVREHRTVDAPFEVVASGIADGERRVVEPFVEVGATWWFESDEGYPGWEERMLERIRHGPPR
jgi:hypothetical protein